MATTDRTEIEDGATAIFTRDQAGFRGIDIEYYTNKDGETVYHDMQMNRHYVIVEDEDQREVYYCIEDDLTYDIEDELDNDNTVKDTDDMRNGSFSIKLDAGATFKSMLATMKTGIMPIYMVATREEFYFLLAVTPGLAIKTTKSKKNNSDNARKANNGLYVRIDVTVADTAYEFNKEIDDDELLNSSYIILEMDAANFISKMDSLNASTSVTLSKARGNEMLTYKIVNSTTDMVSTSGIMKMKRFDKIPEHKDEYFMVTAGDGVSVMQVHPSKFTKSCTTALKYATNDGSLYVWSMSKGQGVVVGAKDGDGAVLSAFPHGSKYTDFDVSEIMGEKFKTTHREYVISSNVAAIIKNIGKLSSAKDATITLRSRPDGLQFRYTYQALSLFLFVTN